MHLGDKNCDMKAIESAMKAIKESDNTYVILNGDLMNTATKNSISDVYTEKLTPTEQIIKTCELLEPIKDRILVIHPRQS